MILRQMLSGTLVSAICTSDGSLCSMQNHPAIGDVEKGRFSKVSNHALRNHNCASHNDYYPSDDNHDLPLGDDYCALRNHDKYVIKDNAIVNNNTYISVAKIINFCLFEYFLLASLKGRRSPDGLEPVHRTT